MLEFFKKSSSSKDSGLDPSLQVNLIECDKPEDFIAKNFPLLHQTSMVCIEHNMARKSQNKEIDISIYFDAKDKYLVSDHTKDAIISREFGVFEEYELKARHVAPRLKKLEKYNDILNGVVKDQATKNFDKFQEGVNNLDFFKYIVGLCTEDLSSSRKALKEARNDLAQYAVKISRLLRQRTMKQKALAFLTKFKENFTGMSKAAQLFEKDDMTESYEVIPIIRKAKQEFEMNSALVSQFECLRNCERYLETRFEDLKRRAHKGIENSILEWDEQKFGAYLKFWFMYELNNPSEKKLKTRLPVILKQSIKTARNKVIDIFYAQKNASPTLPNGNMKPLEKAKFITLDRFHKFLNRMYHQMSVIMYNTHLCCRYLEEHKKDELAVTSDEMASYSLEEFYTTLKIAFLALRKEIWEIIQKKIVKILGKAHINEMGYHEIITFLQFSGIFVEIGEDFSLSFSKTFREAIWSFLKNYCTYVHNATLQSLRTMVSVEEWQRLPSPLNYKNAALTELLKHFPQIPQPIKSLMKMQEESNQVGNIDIKDFQKKHSALSSFVTGNPFQIQDNLLMKKSKSYTFSPRKAFQTASIEDLKFEDNLSTAESHEESVEPEENTKEVNEEDAETVFCSSANFVVKNFDRYLLLMNLMAPLALDIFIALLETFQFMVYTVIKNFIPPQFRGALFTEIEPDLSNIKNIKDEELKITTLQNLHDLFLFQKNYKNLRKYMIKILDFFDKSSLRISQEEVVDHCSGALFDIVPRSVGVESVLFVYKHVKYIQNRALKIITKPDQVKVVQDYYSTFEKVIPELRTFVYACFMPHLQIDGVFHPIQTIKWDTSELNEVANTYINKVVLFVKEFYAQIDGPQSEGLSKKVKKDLKKDLINFTFRKLLDNFSKVKKLSVTGRNMMLNDFNHIAQSLASIMDPRCQEKKDFCENYIKAWHLGPEELGNFIIENKESYGLRELEALITTRSANKSLNKTQKKELYTRIENEFVQLIKTKLQE